MENRYFKKEFEQDNVVFELYVHGTIVSISNNISDAFENARLMYPKDPIVIRKIKNKNIEQRKITQDKK